MAFQEFGNYIGEIPDLALCLAINSGRGLHLLAILVHPLGQS